MTLEQWVYGFMTAVASTFVAIGAFLQFADALEEHRDALPDPLELHVNPDAMTTDDLKSDLRQMFSSLGRGSEVPPSAEVKALRSAQGWLFVVTGAVSGALIAWVVLLTNLADYLMSVSVYIIPAISVIVLLGFCLYTFPKVIREYRSQPRRKRVGLVTFVLFLPFIAMVYHLDSWRRDEKHLAGIRRKIDRFHEEAAAAGAWPRWMVGPPPLREEEGTTRIVVEVRPNQPWHPSLLHVLKDQLTEAGYRPVRSPDGGWSVRFCDPVELHRWLWKFDERVVDQPVTW